MHRLVQEIRIEGMKMDRSQTTEASTLRNRAEEQLRGKPSGADSSLTNGDTQRLVHELEVHQIELEMQNAELRQARDEIETALGKYTDLYDFAPVGYFTLDRNGAITAVNLSGASLMEVERSRLIGRHFGLFVANEDRPLFSAFLVNVFESKVKESCEVTLTTETNATRYVHVEAIALGSGQQCSTVVSDITESKRTADALHLEKTFIDTAINSMPGIFYVVDDHKRLIRWNNRLEQFSGRSAEVMPTLCSHDFVAEESHELLELKLNEVFVEHRNTDAELLILDREKRKIPYYCTGSPMVLGDQTYLVGLGIDISDRRRAEEVIERLNTDLQARAAELEAVNLELEAFNYTVAHDLRKPLTVVNGYCQTLRELCGDKLDEQCDGYLREAYNGTWRMNRLIDALLDFSRLGHVEPRREPVNLAAMAHEVAAELKLAEPERRVTFLIADEICADGDARLLRVVLANLLGNAWKYTGTRDEGIIEFGTTEVDGRPVYFVRDNGAGFDMADADKLFIPFQRLPGAEECRGFGIGLATVERIIRRHGGKVWADGVPDKGACFWFTLSAD